MQYYRIALTVSFHLLNLMHNDIDLSSFCGPLSKTILGKFSKWPKAFVKFYEYFGEFTKIFSHFDFYFMNEKKWSSE